jgi:hypothetical protein
VSRAARAALSIAGIAGIAGIAAIAGACRRTEPPPAAHGSASGASAEPKAATGAPAATACTELPFAESTPVPEASGAAWLTIDGALSLVVISDSGNGGMYAIVDPESGVTREQGKLPLGEKGDDLEGIAARGDKLYIVTSPGWMRVYERKGQGFALVDGPYPLGPIDIEDKGGGLGNKPPQGAGMVCGATHTNCGRNYEGLCLAPGRTSSRCVGFAAAKADGHLYCIVERGGKLAVEHAGSIPISRPGALSDCAFSEDNRLYVGTNLFDAGNVYRVTGWEEPERASLERIGPLLIGFPETLAVRGDVIYRMSDTGRPPSFMKRYRCPGR